MESYDLVVLGGGPAGEKAAVTAAYFGKRVLLVEKESVFGGACSNTGTLPSKTLRETALYLSGYRQRGLYGVEMKLDHQVGVKDLLYRERYIEKAEQERIRQNLGFYQVDSVVGRARFLDAHTLEVATAGATRTVRSDYFVIATGSRPNRPAPYPFEAPNVYDSDEILQLDAVPSSLLVVGAGVIGTEYACTFAALGIPVTLIDAHEPLLPFLDRELCVMLHQRMAALGVRYRIPDAVTGVDVRPEHVTLQLKSGERVEAAAVLVAAGRLANSAGLGLEALGVQLDPKGHIPVNAHYQTAVPHIYAAGDVIGFPALASTSMEQGRLAVIHAFGLQLHEVLSSTLPYALYTIPEVSMAGDTEEALKAKGVDYVAGRAYYAQNPRGQIIGDGGGMLKLLFRRGDLKLLGVHVIGELASEIVHVGLIALLTGATADLFLGTCFNFPTLSDSYKYATFNALGQVLPGHRHPEARGRGQPG